MEKVSQHIWWGFAARACGASAQHAIPALPADFCSDGPVGRQTLTAGAMALRWGLGDRVGSGDLRAHGCSARRGGKQARVTPTGKSQVC